MTKPSGTTVPTITEQADQASDAGTLLGLLKDATVEEADYITGLLLTREQVSTDERTLDRIARMGNVGESLVKVACKRFDAGHIKASDGTAVVLSSDDRADMTVANLRKGLGLTERTDRYNVGTGTVAYTDLQRYWQAQRASAEDIERGYGVASADGKADNVSAVIGAIARATFERTDPTKAKAKAEQAEQAKAKREQAKAEEAEEVALFAKVSDEISPVTPEQAAEWSADQCRAAVVVLNRRIAALREQAKAEQAEQAEQAPASEQHPSDVE